VTAAAIVQARMGSTRLPGKALVDIAGMSMLARVIDRTRRCRLIQRIVIATTVKPHDDAIVEHAREIGVDVYRGDEEDVLDRYYQAALTFPCDVVVRITSDCPLLDPGIADQVVRPLLLPGSVIDYRANTLERTYPRGLDVEAVPFTTLERVWRDARSFHERAHVFPHVYEHPEKFVLSGMSDPVDRSYMRWTVDTAEDLAFVRAIYAELATREFSWLDVLRVIDAHPGLLEINAQVRQKSAHDQ
jgi:spore coat polysaccharide biosynthesis protein SpsF